VQFTFAAFATNFATFAVPFFTAKSAKHLSVYLPNCTSTQKTRNYGSIKEIDYNASVQNSEIL